MPLPDYLAPYSVYDPIYKIFICDESTGENFERFAQSEATRQIVCSWEDRATLVNNLGGVAQLNPFSAYSYLFAAPYPDAPGLLFYSGVRTEGIPVGGLSTDPYGLVAYPLARCWIKYRTQPYVEIEGTVTAVDVSVQDIVLPQQPGSFAFGSSSGPPVDPNQFPAAQGTFITFSVTTFNLLSIPESTMLTAAAAPIDVSGLFGTQTGYLLYAGTKSVRRMNQAGIEMWDCTSQALFSPTGWGYAFNPASGMFEQIFNVQTGKPAYLQDTTGSIPALFTNSGL
jgi:hypothetical protein